MLFKWISATFKRIGKIERLSITFTLNSKREIEPCNQVSLCFSFTVHYFYPSIRSFSQFCFCKNCFELFLSAHIYFKKFSTWICRLPYKWSLKSLIVNYVGRPRYFFKICKFDFFFNRSQPRSVIFSIEGKHVGKREKARWSYLAASQLVLTNTGLVSQIWRYCESI